MFETNPLGRIVWEDRYGLKDESGNLVEKDILDTFGRVAKAISSKEKDPKKWEKKFYDILAAQEFCPAGRVLAQAGTHYSQLLNCFVLPFENDSLESIMDTAKSMSIIMKYGGGCGFNYSTLRPSGSYIKGVNGRSCGVLGFVHMMSTISEVIEQGGCLTKDTLINTEKGLLYFDEIAPLSIQRGWHSYGGIIIKTKDGDNKSCRYFVNGISDILKIRTDCGIHIKGTLFHKLFVFSDNGPEWREFKDVRKGDWVISLINQHSGVVQSLSTSIQKKHFNCVVPEKLPNKIDEDFAFFLGYFLGNGFFTLKGHRFGVTIPDKSYLNIAFVDLCKKLFGSNISVLSMKKKDDQSTTYYISNRIIKEFLTVNGLSKSKSLTASIPQKIRCSPRNIVAAYLAGLFEADGALCHGYPMLTTTSSQLVQEVQTLLFGLGIPCIARPTKRGKGSFSNTLLYHVKVVSFVGLKNWNDNIIPHAGSRFNICRNFQPDMDREKAYILPHSPYWVKKAHQGIESRHDEEAGFLKKKLRSYLRGDHLVTLSSYQSLLDTDCLKDFLPEVGNFYFSKVEDIISDKDYTYDIEVENSHSYVANSVVSHNSRRSASLGLLEVWHPDIWEYISYKTEHGWDRLKEFIDIRDEEKWRAFKFENLYKLQMYNVSVGVSDEFFDALRKDAVWPLVWNGVEWDLYTVRFRKHMGGMYVDKDFEVTADCDKAAIWKVKKKVPFPTAHDTFEIVSKRKIKASEIWERICFNAWADGCPGLINVSAMRRMHNLEYVHPFSSTNPCGEVPLGSPAGSCNLGSLILPTFVKDGEFDFDRFKSAIRIAVRFMDDVIDNCMFPIELIEKVAREERRVGLGTMGVHDMLISMRLGYDTPEGRQVVEKVLQCLRDEAYRTSVELAKEKGSFPLYDKDKYLNSGFIKTLPEDIIQTIAKNGIRCSTLISQAPTGTIGTMYGVSTGCEPHFALAFQRNTRLGSYEDGCRAYIQWRSENPNKEKPLYFKTAMEISPENHIKMMILFSKYVDNAVSKTINLPEGATVDDVKKSFLYAMDSGVKGLTIFRENSKEGVLVRKDKPVPAVEEAKKVVHELMERNQNLDVNHDTEDSRMSPKKRGNRTVGATSRVHMQGHNLYITANRNEEGDLVELFVTVGESKNPDAHHTSGVEDSWAEGLAKTISLALRAGVQPTAIIRNLKNIPSDKPVFSTVGDCKSSELIPSPPHAIARVMEEELRYAQPQQIQIIDEIQIEKKGCCKNCGSTSLRWLSKTCYECNDCGVGSCAS